MRTTNKFGFLLLVVSLLGLAAFGQASRPRSVTLLARVASIGKISVDRSVMANSGPQFTFTQMAANEIEVEIRSNESADSINIPVVVTCNTRNYTLQASSPSNPAGTIELVDEVGSAHEIVSRARMLSGPVTFALGRVDTSPSLGRALVQIRLGKMVTPGLRVRLRIQPIEI